MENAEKLIARKREISARYNKEFRDIDNVNLFPAPNWAESACWFSGIQVLTKNNSVNDLIKSLQDKGIGTRSFWKPVHHQKPFIDAPTSTMKTTELLWPSILILPCSTNLGEDEQTQVINAVRECLK
jgi:dTDP-4-amino-4,6-dideoxygalactose transaminase